MDHVLPEGIQACSSQSMDPNGGPFIKPPIKVATTEHVVIDYEEIMPCDCPLPVDFFGNHAVQKIICHGPVSYKRKLISNLSGHVLGLRFYAHQLIQKWHPHPQNLKRNQQILGSSITEPEEFLKECAGKFSFSEKDAQAFSRKFLNIVDSLKQE